MPLCLQCFDTVDWAAGRASNLMALSIQICLLLLLLLLLLLFYCKKTEWWSAGMVICLKWSSDLHMAQLMLLPLTVCCFSEIHIGFIFLVLAHSGSTGKRSVKRVCVCVFGQKSQVTVFWLWTAALMMVWCRWCSVWVEWNTGVLQWTAVSWCWWHCRFCLRLDIWTTQMAELVIRGPI